MSERQQTLCVSLINCHFKEEGGGRPLAPPDHLIRSNYFPSSKLNKNTVSYSEDAACLVPDILIFDIFIHECHCGQACWILLKGHRIIVQVLVHITLIWQAYLWCVDHVATGMGGNLHNIS